MVLGVFFFGKKTGGVEYVPRLSRRSLDELIGYAEDWTCGDTRIFDELLRSVGDVERVLSRHIKEPDYLKKWVNIKRPKRYNRKSIVVDDALFYIPYHYSIDDFGVYFRIERLWNDFKCFLNFMYCALENPRVLRIIAEESDTLALKLRRLYKRPHSLVCSLFVEYIVFHYAHGIVHHVFEDVSRLLEMLGKGKYCVVGAREEEEYALYVAFSTLEKYMPGVLSRSKKAERLIDIFYPLIPDFEWRLVESINYATTKLLYVYYIHHKESLFRPVISASIREGINTIFWLVWKHHYTYEDDVIVLRGKPIMQRIYLARL